jgi:hypothetical protein
MRENPRELAISSSYLEHAGPHEDEIAARSSCVKDAITREHVDVPRALVCSSGRRKLINDITDAIDRIVIARKGIGIGERCENLLPVLLVLS